MLSTRPRMASGTRRWIDVLHSATQTTIAAPQTKSTDVMAVWERT